MIFFFPGKKPCAVCLRVRSVICGRSLVGVPEMGRSVFQLNINSGTVARRLFATIPGVEKREQGKINDIQGGSVSAGLSSPLPTFVLPVVLKFKSKLYK